MRGAYRAGRKPQNLLGLALDGTQGERVGTLDDVKAPVMGLMDVRERTT